jgi:DNA-binding transcriptional regulator GbsR (MarR family)
MISHKTDNTEVLKKQHIEKTGVSLEQIGFPRMVGRTLGYLMVSEPPYRTFNEIQEYLQASKSSISTSLQFLLKQGLVGYFTLPGDRKRYFKFNAESWLDLIKKDICQFTTFRKLLLECVALRNNDHEKFNQALVDIADLYGFFEKELPSLIQRWEQDRKQNFIN